MPTRLLPDNMLVFPSDGRGGFLAARLVKRIRFEVTNSTSDDAHRASATAGRVFVDATNSEGAFEIPAGSKMLINAMPRMMVATCRRCCIIRGEVHHWELEVG
jgi:6,7-dimethyl-8-ribityllumazine synthase